MQHVAVLITQFDLLQGQMFTICEEIFLDREKKNWNELKLAHLIVLQK